MIMKGDVYHILNRGVEKRKIFLNDKDYLRFVHNLYDFNDKNEVLMSYFKRRLAKSAIRKPTKALVDILCWCLMPNHYHVLVKERIDGGAGMFSKKISSGYTQYFNLKNDRSGVLFQGKSKIIPIKKDEHFAYLPYYILSNPVKLVERNWKEDGIKDFKKVRKFLENYKWSSLHNVNERKSKKDFLEWLVGYRIADQP